MILTLQRDYRDERCTLGMLEVYGRRVHTLERPWVPSLVGGLAGQKGISCVPPGRYRLFPHSGEAFRDVWALVNPALDVYHWDADVPRERRGKARTTVLIHPANYVSELRGCIAPGKDRRRINRSEWAVFRSRDALNEIKQWVAGALDLWIDITEEKLNNAMAVNRRQSELSRAGVANADQHRRSGAPDRTDDPHRRE